MKKSIICGIIATACWGFSTVFSKFLLARFEPLSLLMIQLVASNISIWVFLAFQQHSKLSKIESFKYSLPGILQPGLAFTFGAFGLNLTTANNDAIIWATESIVVIIFASIFFHESNNKFLLLLATCGALGTIMATCENYYTHFSNSTLLGNGLVLLGVFCAAIYTIYTQHQLTYIEPMRLTALHQLSGLILVVIFWLIYTSIINTPISWNVIDVLLTGISGITSYALPFVLYLFAIKNMGAARTSILLALPPIFTILGSSLVLGEHLNYLQWLGVLITLVSVSGICISQNKAISPNIICD